MITELEVFRKEKELLEVKKEAEVKKEINKVEMARIGSVTKRLMALVTQVEKSFKKERMKCPYMKKSEALVGFSRGEFTDCSHKDHGEAGSIIRICSLKNCPFTKRK